MITKYIVLLLCLLGPLSYADSWNLPTTKARLSYNKLYCIVTIPRGDTLESQYLPEGMSFEHPAEFVLHDSAYGILYKRGVDSVYRPVWETSLNFPVDPVGLKVHDEGKWVVMFDNWHFVGDGDNVVVIYDSTGSMVRSFSLADMFSKEVIAGFGETSSSIWWRCGARFIDGTDEFEFRVPSNGEVPVWSPGAVCEDYLRLSLSTGEVISFYSRFDEILATYPDSCYNTYTCPTVRYFHYLMNHPNSSICVRCDSLDLSGNQVDSLRTIYECFKYDELPELGAAFQYLGRRVNYAATPWGTEDYVLLVEASEEVFDYARKDSIPVVVRLADSSFAVPMAPHESTYSDALLNGARLMFKTMLEMETSDTGIVFRMSPRGGLSFVCTPDTMYTSPTNVYVHELDFGTRITIDLTKQLEWVRPEKGD